MPFNIKTNFNMTEFLNTTGTVYFKNENLSIDRYSGFDDWMIIDLTSALARGKTCLKFTIKSDAGHGNLDVTNFILRNFGNNLVHLWRWLTGLDVEINNSVAIGKITVWKSELKGVNVFSPFNLDKIKPLKKMPAKWTLAHVKAAIINGQFKDLKCKGVYTDDYAWDAAVNFRKGKIAAPLAFIKRIIESPSGWWTSLYDGTVKVCCHTFDCNEFVPVV